MKVITRKSFFHSYALPAAMAVLIGVSNCSYREKGHANTPAENSENRIKEGIATFVSSGTTDVDNIHREK